MPAERPVTTPDHLLFLNKAFPEAFEYADDEPWINTETETNIYEHGRAGHDKTCMSTRAKPVGEYHGQGPINFRFQNKFSILPGITNTSDTSAVNSNTNSPRSTTDPTKTNEKQSSWRSKTGRNTSNSTSSSTNNTTRTMSGANVKR